MKNLQNAGNLIPFRVRSWIKYIPGLKQLQQHLMSTHLHGAAFQHRIKGGPANGLLYPVVLPQDKRIWLGNYEQEFSEALAADVIPGGVCYDIGGYRGFFSGMMACQGAASVHVFEPLPENVIQIRKMVALNPTLAIKVHQMALADVTGETSFSVMPETSMGKLGESKFDSGDCPEERIQVILDTLDTMLRDHRIEPAQLVKIDVEGAELLVLRGGVEFIAKYRPTFFSEAHSHELARGCVEFLKPLGYSVTVLKSGKEPDFHSEPSVCHIVAKSI